MIRGLTVLVILLAPVDARAQDATPAPETRALVVQGAPGTWFPRASADRLLAGIEELRHLRDDVVPALNGQVGLAHETEQLLRANLALTEQQVRIWKESFGRLARQIRPHRTAWYETPVFWLSIGALATGALAVGLAFGLGEAR